MLFQKISLEFFFLFTWREDQQHGNIFFSWKSLALFCFITKVRNFKGRFYFFIHLMRKQSICHREEDVNYMQEIIPWSHTLNIVLKAQIQMLAFYHLNPRGFKPLEYFAIFFGLFFLFSFCWNKTPSTLLCSKV